MIWLFITNKGSALFMRGWKNSDTFDWPIRFKLSLKVLFFPFLREVFNIKIALFLGVFEPKLLLGYLSLSLNGR